MKRRRPGRRSGEPTSRVKGRSATAGRGRPTAPTRAPSSTSQAGDNAGDSPANLSPLAGQLHDVTKPTPAEQAVIDATSALPLRVIEHRARIGRHRLATLRKYPLDAKLDELTRLQAAGLLVLTIVAIPGRGLHRVRTD